MIAIDKTIFIQAGPEQVWRHLEDPDLLAGWLMRNSFEARPGARFQFLKDASGEWDGVIESRLVEFDPPRRLSFTWNANNIGADTLVTIELSEQGSGTRLRLLHTNWEQAIGETERLCERHASGWDDHLWILGKQVGEAVQGKSAPPIDWTRFSLHVAIEAEPERVFDSWATSRGMERFFVEMMSIRRPDGQLLDAEEPATEGCRFTWRWDSGAAHSGQYLQVRPGRELGFTFGDSEVRIRCLPYRSCTLLELCQSKMPDTEHHRMHWHCNCRAAWVYFLTVLKIRLERGVDGRDRTRATGGSFSTFFDPAAIGVDPA
jgi:uncharacterized protein YndB with AHSA1/START domain